MNLHVAIDDYLTLRRALGHKLERHDRLFHDFVGFLHTHETTTITCVLAVEWASMPAGKQPRWWTIRLNTVRMFALCRIRHKANYAERDRAAAAAVADGVTWAEIAGVLGVSAQAAHKRFRWVRVDPGTGVVWREPPLPR